MKNITKSEAVVWTAQAVQTAIDASGLSKTTVSDLTGIPYPTLNRKFAAKTEFSFSDLLELSDALGVPPSDFTPPIFERAARSAA